MASQLRFWGVAVLGCAADLATKHWAFVTLDRPQGPESIVLIPGFITLHVTENEGAVFGSLAGWQPVFIFASFAALIFVAILFAGTRPNQRFLHFAFGLIMAGAAGNLYDRIVYDHVRDFIHFHILRYEVWPWIFNLADACLCVAVGVLLIYFLRPGGQQSARDAAS